jgi:methylated-DNA-[protein]-cysteine S-methyltransferase
MTETTPLLFCTLSTPCGPFSAAVDASGRLVAAVFGGRDALSERLKGARLAEDPDATRRVRAELQSWFSGKSRGFTVPLAAQGTPFQLRVWESLRSIPYGQTRSYGDIARQLRSSARAVGRANATNPICIVTPCHRVIGADGSLTGYAFGEERKRWLLALERA